MNKYGSSIESQPLQAPKSFSDFDGLEMAHGMVATHRSELSEQDRMDKAILIAPHIKRLVNNLAERDQYEDVAQKVDGLFDETVPNKSKKSLRILHSLNFLSKKSS
jgi:hypothetical protein